VRMMADVDGGIVSRPEGSMGMRDSCRSKDLRVGPEGSCGPGAGEGRRRPRKEKCAGEDAGPPDGWM
jgi:hypothetical protein